MDGPRQQGGGSPNVDGATRAHRRLAEREVGIQLPDGDAGFLAHGFCRSGDRSRLSIEAAVRTRLILG